MASPYGFQFTATLDPEIFILKGFISLDSSGVVLNTAGGTNKDQDDDALLFPRGLTVAKSATGIYAVTLAEGWVKLDDVSATPYVPASQATLIGTVDLRGLTLSSLNGLTLQTDADVGSNYTTTFTTPSSIADIAAQINAGNAGTSVLASIVTDASGAQHLKIVSTTQGSTSTLVVAGASTADTVLGISNTAQTGQPLGSFVVTGFNPQGVQRGYQPAQTITLLYQAGGTVASLAGCGFWVKLMLCNTQR